LYLAVLILEYYTCRAWTMSLIRAVETSLGSIDTWPRHILEYLLRDAPTLAKVEVLAFCYGNGIPCPMAYQLFHACNGRTNAYTIEHFYTQYSFWESSTDEVHLLRYYNMSVKKYVYINGPLRNQLALVLPEMGCVKFRIDNTAFPLLISHTGTCSSDIELSLAALCS